MSTQQRVVKVDPDLPDRDEQRDEPETSQESPTTEQAPVAPPRVVVPRWVQLVLLPIALLGTWALARASGKVLLIFIVAGVIALILNPAVSFLQRRGLPRALAVLSVYLAFFVSIAGIGLLLSNPISHQVRSFTHDVPSIVNRANKSLADFQTYLNKKGVHVQFIKQGKTALQTLQDKVVQGSSSIVSFGGDLLAKVVSAGFDLVLILVLSIYMLVYGERIGRLARRVMPDGDGSRDDDYPTLVQRAVAGYVRGQLLFSLAMGAGAAAALYLFGLLGIFPAGKTYALVFGAFYGLMELVPYLGPVLGAVPPVLVALFSDPVSALWVALLFVGLQQLEGHVVAPQTFGHTLRTNPLLVIFALLLGLQIYGLVGALVALPILSILRETLAYLARHLAFEPWDRTPGPLL